MIKVEMHGRLGNQMFQYAAARSLQKKNKQKLVFSFREVLNENDKEGGTGWEDYLKYMNVTKYDTYNKKNLLFYKSSIMQIIITLFYYLLYKPILLKNPYDFKKLYNVQYKWAPLLNKYGIRWIKQGYFEYDERYRGNYLLNGGFESKKYFDDIRTELLREFTPKIIDNKYNDIKKYLKVNNSICISVRHFELKDKTRDSIYNVCDKSYYEKAIMYMIANIENPIFYVCSNDHEWVKKNINFKECKVIYEDFEANPVIKLNIMSCCKHFIISNSTFSWWAQYLSTFHDKTVIAPEKWYNSDFNSNLLEDENCWVKIS